MGGSVKYPSLPPPSRPPSQSHTQTPPPHPSPPFLCSSTHFPQGTLLLLLTAPRFFCYTAALFEAKGVQGGFAWLGNCAFVFFHSCLANDFVSPAHALCVSYILVPFSPRISVSARNLEKAWCLKSAFVFFGTGSPTNPILGRSRGFTPTEILLSLQIKI